MKVRIKQLAALSVSLLLAALPLSAGGPLIVDANGPVLWPNGGVNIPFNIDLGGLGPLDNAQATQEVLDAFQRWQDIPTASNTYQDNGPMPEDVSFANNNFIPLVLNILAGQNNSDGLSPVIFDENGQMFDFLFGLNTGVLGIASPDTFDANGVPIEAVCLLNGGAVLGGFPLADFIGVIFHEFGHYSGLAHTVTNGEAIFLGDETGPTPDDTTFGAPPSDQVETMYPFAVVGGEQASPHHDDISALSSLYPEPNFLATTSSIRGRVLNVDGVTPLTGVNVICRNLASPFVDAASSISGDRGIVGEFRIDGLTPNANYACFIDEILAGGFSTIPLSPLPGPEEFHNGPRESNNSTSPDDPADFEAIGTSPGSIDTIDFIINSFAAGDTLPLGDDAPSVELPLPFPFTLCDQTFNSVFVNPNGNLTFGAADATFIESPAAHLGGPPRISGLFDDLNPSQGGRVFFTRDNNSFTVNYEDVPEFLNTGANNFSITLRRASGGDDDDDDDGGGSRANRFSIAFGELTAQDGITGYSCGGEITSTFEEPSDLSGLSQPIRTRNLTAVFEVFNAGNPVDLANSTLEFRETNGFRDRFENNDSLSRSRRVSLPFNTADVRRFTEIRPAGDDVDFFRFRAFAGQSVIAEVLAGQLDTVLGLFQITSSGDDDDDDGGRTGVLLATDDDGGAGVLSRLVFEITETAEYAIAVSTFDDLDFTGDGIDLAGQGRYVLDVSTIDGFLLDLGDDQSVEVDLPFPFPFQGSTFNSVFVNSNGNLTFGAGDTDFTESVAEFLNESPRIAPLWDDLSPNQAGMIIYRPRPIDKGGSDDDDDDDDDDGGGGGGSAAEGAVVIFSEVTEFIAANSNSFTVTLRPNGDIEIVYGQIDAVDGIVGVTEGGGAANPGETDLSAAGSLSAQGTTFEQFVAGDAFDLAFLSLFFLF